MHCRQKLPITRYHEMATNPLLFELSQTIQIKHAYAFLHYNKKGIAQTLLHQLKYKDRTQIGTILGRWFGYAIKEAIIDNQIDIIMPIPIHRRRWMKRGYNQSEIIARGMNEILKLPLNNFTLKRHRFTKSQTKKDKVSRWQHANDLYYLRKIEAIRQKRILLVDDVITTGATISSAIDLLHTAGIMEVSVACLATGK